MNDPVNPDHYKDESGIECIDVVGHMNFNIGNAIKYLWRCGKKGNAIEDLQKAIRYCEFEIARLQHKGMSEVAKVVTEKPGERIINKPPNYGNGELRGIVPRHEGIER